MRTEPLEVENARQTIARLGHLDRTTLSLSQREAYTQALGIMAQWAEATREYGPSLEPANPVTIQIVFPPTVSIGVLSNFLSGLGTLLERLEIQSTTGMHINWLPPNDSKPEAVGDNGRDAQGDLDYCNQCKASYGYLHAKGCPKAGFVTYADTPRGGNG